jgi:hypothetical protein
MANIVFGRDKECAGWAAAQIPHIGTPDKFGPCVAVAVTPSEENLRPMAVIVFHDFIPDYSTCQISAAAKDPRWASRQTVRALLAVPFIQYGCNKVYTAIPHTADRVIRFNQAIGFIREAVLKDQFGPGVHAVICRMMAKDYERLYLGERRRKAA